MKGRIWIPEAPFILPNRSKELEINLPKVGLAGRFYVDLVHARTGLIAQHFEFDNLITDVGLDAIRTNLLSALYQYCAVGTGSTAPAVSQVALDSELARTNSDGGIASTGGWAANYEYRWLRFNRSFTTAQANGNLTEVGMFSASTGGTMWTRQLFKDGSGNPTTITKTSEYELRVVYEIRVYPAVADRVISATIDGAAQNVTMRPADISGSVWADATASLGMPRWGASIRSGALAAITASPSGVLSSKTDEVEQATTAGVYKRSWTISYTSSQGNGDILSFTLDGANAANSVAGPVWQGQLTTALTKTNTQRLDMAWSFTWGRR